MNCIHKLRYIYFFLWISFTIAKSVNNNPSSLRSFVRQLNNNRSVQNIITLGALACPFMNFCTRDQENNLSLISFPLKPCCKPCSCTKTCRYSRTCCADAKWSIEGFGERMFNHMSCVSSFLQNNYLRELKASISEIRYTTVNTCPRGNGAHVSCNTFDNTRLTNAVHLNNTQSFYDIIKDNSLVSSQDGHVIFRNEYCARCHNVSDFVRWIPSVARCKDDLFKMRFSQNALLAYSIENCSLFSEPPPGFNTDELICGRDDDFWISKCNATGQWDKYDPDIKDLCASSQYSPVYQTGTEKYSNVFCMLCNKPNGHNFTSICKGAPSVFRSLGYILNLEWFTSPTSEEKSSEQSVNICREEEILDPYFNICRQLECPFQRIPKHDDCKNHHFNGTKIYFALSFKISFAENTKLLPSINGDKKIIDVIQFLDHLNLSSCNYLQADVKSYYLKPMWFLKYLSLQIHILETNACALKVSNSLLFKSKSNSSVTVTLYGHQYDAFLEINIPVKRFSHNGSAYDSFPPIDGEKVVSFTDVIYNTSISINLRQAAYKGPVEGMPCPFIILDEKEYFILIFNKTGTSLNESVDINEQEKMQRKFIKRMFYVDIQTEFLYFICLGDYIKRDQIYLGKLHSFLNDIRGILTFALTCLSMVSIIVCILLFCLIGKMKSVPSKVFVTALINLFIAQGLFQFGVEKIDVPYFCCVLIGVLLHFSWLSAVFALNGYCVLVALKLTSLDVIQHFRVGDMVKSVVYIYGLPCVFILINVLYTWFSDGHIGYGNTLCYIDNAAMRTICFALPIFLTVVVNCLVNTYTILKARQTAIGAGRRLHETKNATVYFRFMMLTGLAWVFGVSNEIYSSSFLQYCFIISVAGQGTFLLVAFHFDKISKRIGNMTVSKVLKILKRDSTYPVSCQKLR